MSNNFIKIGSGDPYPSLIPDPVYALIGENETRVIVAWIGDEDYADVLTAFMFEHGYVEEDTATKGGRGSGNFGHAGRPGKVGGSAAGKYMPQHPYSSGAFRKWFGTSKVVDSSGDPLVVYHGTTHAFTQFVGGGGRGENFLGDAFYFTDSQEDVSKNYGGVGPDLTSRIETYAEQIMQQWYDDRGKDQPRYGTKAYEKAWEKARAEARKKVAGEHEGVVMPVYLKMKHPLKLLEGDEGTQFIIRTKFDRDGEFVSETGNGVKLYSAILAVGDEYGFDGQEVWEELGGGELDFTEGVSAMDVDKALRNHRAVLYHEEGSGDLDLGNIMRDIYRKAGYDGVIMDSQFGPRKLGIGQTQGMGGLNPDTRHYVLFEPAQIKSVFNIGAFDPNDPDILKEAIASRLKGGKGSGNFGHAGRPGKVGGSQPNKGGVGFSTLAPISTELSKKLAVNWVHPPSHVDDSMGQAIDLIGKAAIKFVRGSEFSYPSIDVACKHMAVSKLAKAAFDGDYEKANKFIEQWALTSNDLSVTSHEIQRITAEEFGVELSEWQKEGQAQMGDIADKLNQSMRDRIAQNLKNRDGFFHLVVESGENVGIPRASLLSGNLSQDDLEKVTQEFYKDTNDWRQANNIFTEQEIRKSARHIYAETQKYLRHAGISPDDDVVLFRGYVVRKEERQHYVLGDERDYHGNAIESWAYSYITGTWFGNVTVAAQVKARNIFSLPGTGIGCLSEYEIVIFGGYPNSRVTVVSNRDV